MPTYKIIRFIAGEPSLTVKTGLTLEDALAHCLDPETSSITATKPEAMALTEKHGAWFDGYTEEK